MSRFQLVVFDWDGTLMDSEARIVAAVRSAIECADLEPRSDQAIREIIGLGLPEAVRALYPEEPEQARTRLAATYRQAFGRAIAERPAELFPHARETLEALEAAGYLLAVATGKSRAGLQRDLDLTGLHTRFVATRTADECGSKPHPRMLRELLDELGLEPSAALMVGDTLFDLEMAHNAGVPAAAAGWGVHAADRLRAASPEVLLDTLGELPEWLARRSTPRSPDSP